MSWEIERRFLVRVPDGAWAELGEGRPLRQGYVSQGETSVRIRVGEEQGAVLTCKSGSGIRRHEVETVVPGEVAEALFTASGDRVIEKVRWSAGAWVVDRFSGHLTGLALAEIELEDEGEEMADPPAAIIILREVTDDNRFTSGHLARLGSEEQRLFVRMVYSEVGE